MTDEIGYDFSDIDTSAADEAFRRGLKSDVIGASRYLDELERRLLVDLDSTESDTLSDGILDSFNNMKKLIASPEFRKPENYKRLRMDILVENGLSVDLLPRARVFCMQIDSISPTGNLQQVN